MSVGTLKKRQGLCPAPHPWSLARWMPLQKQCEPRLGANNDRLLRSRESPEFRTASLYISHYTPSLSDFVGFIAWIPVPTTKKELNEKRGNPALRRSWCFGRSDRTKIRLPTGWVTQTFLTTAILKRRGRPPIICNSSIILLRSIFHDQRCPFRLDLV